MEKEILHSKKNIIKVIFSFLVIICIIFILASYLINDDFRKNVDTNMLGKKVEENLLKTIEINPDSNPHIYAYSKYITVLNKNVLTIYNQDNTSTTVAFNVNGVFSQDAAIYLDKYKICVRAGNHCAKMAKNVLNVANTCRISLSFYNTRREIDLLINVLKNSKNIWEEIL